MQYKYRLNNENTATVVMVTMTGVMNFKAAISSASAPGWEQKSQGKYRLRALLTYRSCWCFQNTAMECEKDVPIGLHIVVYPTMTQVQTLLTNKWSSQIGGEKA